MQTAVISYRVADFLKQHPPFQYMEEADLVGLAARGRVKFHESDEYLIWQGAAHGPNILVIQQGTVSIWEEGARENGKEAADNEVLRDMRGTGDLLGIERFAGAEVSLHSAKSTSDVVVYAFPAEEFAALVAKYPAAGRYVAAAASVRADYQSPEQRHAANGVFLCDLVRAKHHDSCLASSSIRDAAAVMRAAGRGAIGVLNQEKHLAGVLTADRILQWIEEGGSDSSRPVAELVGDRAGQCIIPLDSPVSECVLSMASANTAAAAITERGAHGGRFHGLVTAEDLTPVFGEQPPALLQEIRNAASIEALRELNQRVRTFLAESLLQPAAVEWLARFAHFADSSIVERVLFLTSDGAGRSASRHCWCFAGAAGRRESLTQAKPGVVLLVDGDASDAIPWYRAFHSALEECGYFAPVSRGNASSSHTGASGGDFGCASIDEWERRFTNWLTDPVRSNIYLARRMFDLLPVQGNVDLYQRLVSCVARGLTPGFLYLLANDCLSKLPPLTFFRDAVVHGSGEQSDVFDLRHTALDPLVDVGRVFGLAAGRARADFTLGSSTLDRFALAKALLPERQSIFREASETLHAVLFHQARVGIRQRTDGSMVPPVLLSRHDRQELKNGFRVILTLLEFTAECQWLEPL